MGLTVFLVCLGWIPIPKLQSAHGQTSGQAPMLQVNVKYRNVTYSNHRSGSDTLQWHQHPSSSVWHQLKLQRYRSLKNRNLARSHHGLGSATLQWHQHPAHSHMAAQAPKCRCRLDDLEPIGILPQEMIQASSKPF